MTDGNSEVPITGVQENGQTVLNEPKPETKQEKTATFGFNQEGYFHLQVPVEMGTFAILGFLARAAHFLNINLDIKEAQKREKQIIPPQRGFRGFNLFKK